MSMSDPIADLLTRLRNASTAHLRYVDVRWSKLKQNVVQVLKDHQYVNGFLVKEADGIITMRIFLRYNQARLPIIRGMKRVSTPGRRRYVGTQDIPRVFNGMGISILTTPQGVISGDEARKRGVGGEVLCIVW